MTTMTIGRGGEVTLPVPLTDAPMSAELAQEVQEWQGLGQQTWTHFPYEDDTRLATG